MSKMMLHTDRGEGISAARANRRKERRHSGDRFRGSQALCYGRSLWPRRM